MGREPRGLLCVGAPVRCREAAQARASGAREAHRSRHLEARRLLLGSAQGRRDYVGQAVAAGARKARRRRDRDAPGLQYQ